MKPEDVITHFGDGNLTHAARALGVERQTLYNWRKWGLVPKEAQYRVEVLSDGSLKAERPKGEG